MPKNRKVGKEINITCQKYKFENRIGNTTKDKYIMGHFLFRAPDMLLKRDPVEWLKNQCGRL